MNTRKSRFWNAGHLLGGGTSAAPGPRVTDWAFQMSDPHPIDGWPLVYAIGPSSVPYHVSHGRHLNAHAMSTEIVLSGCRKGPAASDIEMSFGLDVHMNMDTFGRGRGRILDNAWPFPSIETAPAYTDTMQIRFRADLADTTTALGIEKLRGQALIGKHGEILIFIVGEMPDGWSTGTSERPESVFSGRTAAFAATDKLTLGIPWISADYGEIVFQYSLAHFHTAAAKVRTLLTPPPAPAEDDSNGDSTE